MNKVKSSQRAKRNLKIFSFIAVFLIAIYAIALQVFATDASFELQADSDLYAKGGEVAVDIMIQTDQEWNSAAITLLYDTEVFDGAEVAFEKGLKNGAGAALARSTANKFTVQDVGEPGRISIAAAYVDSSNTAATYSGTLTLGTLYLPVKEDAPGGPTVIEIQESSGSDARTFLRNGENDYTFESNDLTVTIEVPLESHSVDKTSIYLDMITKKTDTITISYAPEDTSAEKGFTFTSQDESIATVTADGGVATVTAVKPGSTTITVTEFGETHVIPVTVTSSLNGIRLNKTALELNKGNEATLTVTYDPSGTQAKGVEWTTSDPRVATVDSDGKVVAVGGGDATITATSTYDSSIVATCNVNVKVPLTNVSLQKTTYNMSKGDSDILTPVFTPSDTTEAKNITWASNNESVATVTSDGRVIAVGGGTTFVEGKIGRYTVRATINVSVPMDTFTTEDTSVDLMSGQNHQVTTTILPSDTTESKVISWTSSRTSVATVDSNGKITAVGEGTATITGTLENGKKVTITVKVLKSINGISLSQENVTLYKGTSNNKVKLSAIITPADAEEDKDLTWSTSSASIASVDQSGNVTAVGAGTATITATLKNGMKATCTVKVEVPISEFRLTSENSVRISKGENSTIRYQINPSDTTDNKTITWATGDSSVATVNNGVITAVNKGSTSITGTLSNGMSITVIVEVVSPVTGVTINGESEITMNRGENRTLTATINPSDASDVDITWVSENASIASVDSTGKVTAIGVGSTNIKAVAGGKTASVKVTVVVPITGFTATSDTLEVVKGKSANINTEITPNDATESKKITWTSADTTIATVDANGIVKGIKAGNVLVTGTLANGMKVEVNVTVKIIPVESITLSDTTMEVKKGSHKNLTITVNPSDTTEDTSATWESEDETIATVRNGRVVGVKAGTTTVRATVGGKSATCEVTVIEIPLEEISVANTEEKVEIDKTIRIRIIENPDNPDGTTDEVTYTYFSSDETIATVDANGVVKGISKGIVTITVRSSNGLEDTIELRVEEPAITNSPNTGVRSIFVYVLSAFISLSGIGFIITKKKFN